MALFVRELASEAMEKREDFYLTQIAEKLDVDGAKTIGHESSMAVIYAIEYLDVIVKKHIPALPTTTKTIIKQAIQEYLTINPIGFEKPLQHTCEVIGACV